MQRSSRPYQDEALAAWRAAQGRGVVVLPTGAGKTHVACLAIDDRRRSTLVLAPTLDLVRQWYDVLRATFGVPVGVIGGGDYGVEALTVSTYDSAYLHMEHLGDKFGLLVFDECHHLPGPAYALAARAAVAPFRLGLTATPERADGRHADFDALCGPIVYRKDIVDLSGGYLAAVRDRAAHRRARARGPPRARRGARRSTATSSRGTASGCRARRAGRTSSSARRAPTTGGGRMAAYRRQREIAFAAPAKLDYVGLLLDRHRDDRLLLFTQDNATAYALSRRFLIPIITHETRVRERSEILAGLADGSLRRGGHLQGAQRRGRHPGRQRGGGGVGERLGARARPAPRADPARAGRQARAALRAGHRQHGRDLHQRAAARPQCLPLIWSARGAGATSCGCRRPTTPGARASRRWPRR